MRARSIGGAIERDDPEEVVARARLVEGVAVCVRRRRSLREVPRDPPAEDDSSNDDGLTIDDDIDGDGHINRPSEKP